MDPPKLLLEAHQLYLDSLTPLEEARCLKALGERLAKLGQPDAARRRYLAARARFKVARGALGNLRRRKCLMGAHYDPHVIGSIRSSGISVAAANQGMYWRGGSGAA